MKIVNLFYVLKKMFLKTDYLRWLNEKNLLKSWDSRTIFLSKFIKENSCVIDVGCGNQVLRRNIPTSCNYIPIDLAKRTSDTIVVDLNKSFKINNLQNSDYTIFSGVLEYLVDIKYVINFFRLKTNFIILSYNCKESVSCIKKRKELGWVNHFSKNEILEIINDSGFVIIEQYLKFSQLIIFAKVKN